MAKEVKIIVNEMNAQPTKREISRKMDVYRKRLYRAEKRMKKRIESGEFEGAELEAAKRYRAKIAKAIEQSYSKGKKGYQYSLQHYEETTQTVAYRSQHKIHTEVKEKPKGVEKVKEYVKGEMDISKTMKDANIQMRKNLQFQRDLAQSRIEGGVSDISNLETSVFYRATQNIWENESVINRNAAIMRYFKVTSLEEAFNIVMSNETVKRELERIKELSGIVDDTKERMAGKDKDEEDWKYNTQLMAGIPSRIFR